jgi:hypothetical protein
MPSWLSSGEDPDGRLVVDEVAVDDGLPVAVVEDGRPKISVVWRAGVAVRPMRTASKWSSTRRYFEM